jgi:CDGSH-type Zn-finger protein
MSSSSVPDADLGGERARPVVIKTTEHGPLRVKGPFTLVDADGTPYTLARKTVFLCRCGASQRKPFCDGSHARTGFRAAERATSAPDTAGVMQSA